MYLSTAQMTRLWLDVSLLELVRRIKRVIRIIANIIFLYTYIHITFYTMYSDIYDREKIKRSEPRQYCFRKRKFNSFTTENSFTSLSFFNVVKFFCNLSSLQILIESLFNSRLYAYEKNMREMVVSLITIIKILIYDRLLVQINPISGFYHILSRTKFRQV